jgi:type II secretory pathway pseudopilin PulG
MEHLVNNPAIVIIIVAAALSLIMTMVMIPIQQQQQSQQFIQYAQALKKKSFSRESSGPASTRTVTSTSCDRNSPCITTLCQNSDPCHTFESNPPLTVNINNSTDTNNNGLSSLMNDLPLMARR